MPTIKEQPALSEGQLAAAVLMAQKTPISVVFEIPYYAVSGLSVKYLKIIEDSGYQAIPWVRYLTRNGSRHSMLSFI